MSTDHVTRRVQQRLDALLAAGASPGLQYTTVDRSGECTTRAAGFADVGTRTALTATTRLMAYSMSKTITAAAVLKLAAAGRLGLDDPAERYVEMPYGPAVTVRRLLCHTAGLRSPIPLRWVHLPPQHAAFDERAALRAVLARSASLAATPGTRFAYTNFGYWLLGAIVEACVQRPFTDYVERELLAPLGIGPHDLGYSLDPTATASGYLEKWSWLNLLKRFVIDGAYIDRYEGSWLKIRAHYVDGPAFGGLIGTTAAFGRWLGDLIGEVARATGRGASVAVRAAAAHVRRAGADDARLAYRRARRRAPLLQGRRRRWLPLDDAAVPRTRLWVDHHRQRDGLSRGQSAGRPRSPVVLRRLSTRGSSGILPAMRQSAPQWSS